MLILFSTTVCPRSLLFIHGLIIQVSTPGTIPGIGAGAEAGVPLGPGGRRGAGAGAGVLHGHGDHPGAGVPRGAGVLHGVGDLRGAGAAILITPTIVPTEDIPTVPDQTGRRIHVPDVRARWADLRMAEFLHTA